MYKEILSEIECAETVDLLVTYLFNNLSLLLLIICYIRYNS